METTLKDSIAQALLMDEPKETVAPSAGTPETVQRKPRKRHSLIEKKPLPGKPADEPKPKRTRRKKNPELKKSHSFTILLTEQTYQRFKAVAEAQELSMNGIVGRLIKKYIILHDIDGENLDI